MENRERLTRAIDRAQHERAVFLGKIEGLSQAQLDFRPARNAWSIGQIAHHVGLAEGVWQGYLSSVLKAGASKKEATLRVSLQEVPFSARLIPDFILRNPFVLGPLSMVVNLLPRPFHSMLFAVPLIKMDSGPRMQPRHGMSRGQLLKLLDETRKEMLAILDPAAGWDLTRFRVVHPLVGDQDPYGILELIASHDQRHSQQVGSITKNSDFPPVREDRKS